MKEKGNIYNGITMSEFISAARTVSLFINGVSSAPHDSDNINADLVITGFLTIPIIEAHSVFVKRFESLKANLEAKFTKDAAE